MEIIQIQIQIRLQICAFCCLLNEYTTMTVITVRLHLKIPSYLLLLVGDQNSQTCHILTVPAHDNVLRVFQSARNKTITTYVEIRHTLYNDINLLRK